MMAKTVAFIDSEVGIADKKIYDLGAIRDGNVCFHSASINNFCDFISGADFLCGHNIIHHDLKYIEAAAGRKISSKVIDTLYLSPLLFPKRPYHALLKDDKLQTDELNNPLNDSKKARQLFYDEVNAFIALSLKMKQIFYCLLHDAAEFEAFFEYIDFYCAVNDAETLIKSEFAGKICENADLKTLIAGNKIELAYVLALISSDDYHSITPPWLMHNFPKIENVIKLLCNTPCSEGCGYCQNKLNIHKSLKEIFGYDSFRTYNGEPLQEMAAQAAVDGKSLLAVFPTGGGKSITFQLPALMAGKAVHGLTVVISPLLSLMKDQVDNLYNTGVLEAVSIC